MKKIIFTITSFILLIVFAGSVIAKKDNSRKFSLPVNAKRVSENTYYLGKSTDKQSGKVVDGFAFVRRKDNNAKPDWAGGGKPKGATKCYGFLANGAKWKVSPEDWVVNSTNSRGLAGNFVLNNLNIDVDKWEDAVGQPILGDGTVTTETLVADTKSPDDVNEVYFANVDSPGAIAVTIVWGIFGGPPSGRELVSWDQVYDDVDYDWGSGDPNKMDFENIATHELGHSVGMADLYDSACIDATMYGYASQGETNKRDLDAGDSKGVQALYQ